MQDTTKPQLVMRQRDLSVLPAQVLPTGYTIRSFQEGDETAWEAIINESFQMKSNFAEAIRRNAFFRADRVFFVCSGSQPVATATSWQNNELDADAGYLHMVGCLTAHQGKGLGLHVSLAALLHMVREGRTAAVLETDDFRIPAIKTYLKLGFIPQIVHENQVHRWQKINTQLGIK